MNDTELQELVEEYEKIVKKRKESNGTTFEVVDTFEKPQRVLRRMRVPRQGIPHDLIVGNGGYRYDNKIYVVEDFTTSKVVKILHIV
jgi:hypothetical protein